MLKNTPNSYGIVAKTFHWLLFLMLTFSIVAGNFLASMPKGTEKLEAAGMHKSFGAILLMLILLRFLWRLLNENPNLPAGTAPNQAMMAKAMHWSSTRLPMTMLKVSKHGIPRKWTGLRMVCTASAMGAFSCPRPSIPSSVGK